MAAEGMVHALEKIHRLLRSDGRLIDLHPNGQPPPIIVRLKDEQHTAGWVREGSDYVKYGQADDALNEVLGRNLYRLEANEEIALTTHCDTLADLREYLAHEWSDAYVEDLVALQIESLTSSPESDQELLLHEVVKIARFVPRY